jgi:predicted ATPase
LLVERGIKGQGLTAEDQLFILTQAGLYLSATHGFSAPEAQRCYERAEGLCQALGRPVLLYAALMGQWRYTYITGNPRAALPIAQRVYSLAQAQNNATIMLGACQALVSTLYYLGEFEAARRYARRGVQIWRSGGRPAHADDLDAPAVVCLCYEALCQWHFGELAACQTTMAEAIALAKALNDANSVAVALHFAAYLARYLHRPAEVECLASELIELSTRQHFALWRACGIIFRGWGRSACGDPAQGLAWIEEGIRDYRATGSRLVLPYWFALKADALHFGHRTSEALEAVNEAAIRAQRTEERECLAELHRLRGIFLAALGADRTQIAGAFCEAIHTAEQQTSTSLVARAEASCVENRDRKGK